MERGRRRDKNEGSITNDRGNILEGLPLRPHVQMRGPQKKSHRDIVLKSPITRQNHHPHDEKDEAFHTKNNNLGNYIAT
jgi:hypothetical protein